MRILFVCNYKPGVGGISGQVEILQKKFREAGHVAEIFNTKASVWQRLQMMSELRNKAKEYDVLHIHCCSGWGFLPAVLGVTTGKRLGKRVVLSYHGGGGEAFFNKHPRLVDRYLKRTDVNIVLSDFLAGVFERHGLPYIIIPNIVEMDSSSFQRRDVIRPCFICDRAHEPLYNIPCVLKAFQRVQEIFPDAMLTLVGGGSVHEDLIRQTKELGLGNVLFTGRVDNIEILKHLNHADVMLSAPKVDNMPVSLIEAMNAGLLVISSNVGGVPYMIKDGENGLLFESDNDAELAEKMLWAVQHQSESKSMIEKARHSAEQYQWDNVKKQLIEAYGICS